VNAHEPLHAASDGGPGSAPGDSGREDAEATLLDPSVQERFEFRAGQFGLYSAFGEGESTFCIASPPTWKDHIECTFRSVGKVTDALRKVEAGEVIGFRGPYGNSFPLESLRGKDLLFVIGGIALPPLRCVIWNCLDLREQFGACASFTAPAASPIWCTRMSWPPGGALRRRSGGDGRSGWRDAGVEGADRVCPTCSSSGLRPREFGRLRLRAAVMIRYSMPVLEKLGFPASGGLHDPGEPDEVRGRQVRSLQHRRTLRLQGRAGLHLGEMAALPVGSDS